MSKDSIYGLTLESLTEWLLEREQKAFRAKQIWDWLYRKRVRTFAEMTNVPKETLALLEDAFVMETLEKEIIQESKDGTTKYLFKLKDGNLIETVLMKQKYGLSVCVTTQVGCNIGCTFCASGILKKSRDLTAGEIVEQIMNVQFYLDSRDAGERVSHIVVMGIGEPFDNYEHLLHFLQIVNSDSGLAIGARHITVSTSGLAPKIRAFAEEDFQVNLAISLHAPNNELRTQIMRINRTFSIETLMEAINYYIQKTNRRVTFEYIMLKDVNDHKKEAEELAQLIKPYGQLAYVNLIPYNPVAEHIDYERSTDEAINAFYQILKKNGINCVVRREHGTDIDAACGQLRSKQIKRVGIRERMRRAAESEKA